MGARQKLQRKIRQYAAEWTEVQPAWLGDFAGDVDTGTPGILYARLLNGRVIEVNNALSAPPIFDLHIQVGRNRNLPKVWQILQVVEEYDTPAAGGEIAYHHAQHEFPAGDTIWINRKQLLTLIALVSDGPNWEVTVYGGIVRADQVYIKVPSQTMDLSAYEATAGAYYVNIEAGEDGTLSANQGSNFGAPSAATPASIPLPGHGKHILATVLFYEGQSELSDSDILIPMPVDRSGSTETLKYDFLLMGA